MIFEINSLVCLAFANITHNILLHILLSYIYGGLWLWDPIKTC